MNQVTVTCPNCKEEISIDQALSHQFKDSMQKDFEEQRKKEREEERQKMLDWKAEQEKKQGEKEAKLREDIEADLKKKILEENEGEQKLLKEELEEKKRQLQESKDQELDLRKQKQALEEREKNLELEKQRELDQERDKIRQQTSEQILREQQLKDAEKNKQIEDMRRKIEELQQKANLTSQQLQGEVLELELEAFLKKEFPFDDVTPVAKGVRGADVLQRVKDQMGRECGTIIWESKRTKNWDEKWVQKLKDDMRSSGADVAILISSVMPQEIKYFGPKDGIFITCFECLLGVSSQIRMALLKESQIKSSVVGKNEKMEVLWNYLSSNQFSQKVEAIVEAFSAMKDDLEKEKRIYTQAWAKREKQIERVINSTIGMHGDLQGLMGAALPQLKTLEFDNFELIETSSVMVTSNDDTTIKTTVTQTVIEDAA